MFTSSVRREIRQFQVVVVQRRQGNVQKSVITCKVVHGFANLNLLLFCRCHWRRRRLSPVPPLPPPPPLRPCHATPGVREGPSLYRSLPALRDVERQDGPGLPSSLLKLPICECDREDELGWGLNSEPRDCNSALLYYYMRNFCNLIGLEQWYFSLPVIWNTYMWKLQTFCW